ncbi:uncharacterized protein LOC129005098 [Macrosteles quadrilineatus]|nr:uncharacterized protein LOC129005098 [Macrosteles quadrilineatus]
MSEEYLIAKYEKRNQPVRFMLLMPGEGFLLVKELVSAEMAFPIPNIPPNLSPFSTFKMDSEVTTALSCLPSISTYDPSEFSSKLYKHLLRKIEHPKPMQLKQESTCTDPSHKSIVVSLEVKKKTRVKKKITEGNRLRRSLHLADPLPKLSESDQQTLAQCLSRQREKFKSSLHQNVK